MKVSKAHVKIELIENMLGTVPKNKDIYKKFIGDKAKELDPELLSDELETIDEIEEKGWTGFHQDIGGLFIYDYMVRGFIRNAANVLKETEFKVKNLKSKITDVLFVTPRKLYFGITEPDGQFERPIRVMTAQGPRVSLVRSDFVKAGRQLEFDIELLEHKEITMDMIREMLEYGRYQGLGQFRNGSFGRFKVIEFTKAE